MVVRLADTSIFGLAELLGGKPSDLYKHVHFMMVYTYHLGTLRQTDIMSRLENRHFSW